MSGDRWRRFYRERNYDRCIYREGEAMIEYLATFFERVGVPETILSVGCGPAVLEFELADRFPATEFTCVDVAEQVIEDDRELTSERGIENVAFTVDSLPDLDLGRQFDLVYCMATLYFVRKVEHALETLYRHVSPDGYLVADYPSETLRKWVGEQDEQKRAFFDLVSEGVNVRTPEEIAAVFEEPVEDYGEAVDASDALGEAIYVQKQP
ncbi:MAG: trans-aconitate 2-methyltransferase [Halapricum sp.]